MKPIEFKDIQGIIVRGYKELNTSCYMLLAVEDKARAREWLQMIVPQITDGVTRPDEYALQIAFTGKGLKALGMQEESLDTFSREFAEGMVTEHRKRILGDVGSSSPDKWQWGGPTQPEVHILLMLYANDHEHLEKLYAAQMKGFKGVRLLKRLDSDLSMVEKRKEHFGFHDGISQPLIKGFSKQGDPDFMIEPGEVLLGYNNEYHILPETPYVSDNPDNILPLMKDGSGNYDLGRNGSYMVFRQLSQNILGFWKYVDDVAKEFDGDVIEMNRVKLASKMVGRWPGGAPLVASPEYDDPALKDFNSFEYHNSDELGLKCPFGAHIRRSNPRNSLTSDPEASDKIVKKHHILRRGRPYGEFINSTDPEEIAGHPKINEDRGLHFICFNTNISRQFEFIQDTWMNSSKFTGLYNDTDPIAGNPIGRCNNDIGDFNIQSQPVRERHRGIPSFVTTAGGAYFFMPGIKALKYIASIK